MCGLFDRFMKKLGKKEEEPMEVVEEFEGYDWESLKNEIGYVGKLAYESGKGLLFHVDNLTLKS